MATFRYKALTDEGTPISGLLEAASQAAAIQQIHNMGHYPISATDVGTAGWRIGHLQALLPRRGVAQRDLAIATQELAMLLQSGLPLDRALSVLIGLGEATRLRQSLAAAQKRVREGVGLAEALAADPVFPKVYVSMVKAGELGGNLAPTLSRLADYLAKAQVIRDTVGSALVYPAILLVTGALSIAVILIVVLPQFEPMFRSAGKSLPFATRVVMEFGQVLGQTWWLLVLLVAGAISSIRRWLRDPSRRRHWDAVLLRLPLCGHLLTMMEMERFGRTLGTLVGNGVALPLALGITKDTLGNQAIAAAVADTAVSLREGDALADRLARTGVFPAIALDFARVGEETGKLDEMLLRQAEICERTVRHMVERLLALLVPGLTVVLGMIVAGLIASMLVAIIGINDLAVK